jgi:hypothetical protein
MRDAPTRVEAERPTAAIKSWSWESLDRSPRSGSRTQDSEKLRQGAVGVEQVADVEREFEEFARLERGAVARLVMATSFAAA